MHVATIAHESRRRRTTAGFTLLDTLISVVVISVSTFGYLAASVTSSALERENRTVAIANELSRGVVEEMLAMPIDQVLKSYNATTTDDPNGAGTARGSQFTLATTESTLVTATETLTTSVTRGGTQTSSSSTQTSSGSTRTVLTDLVDDTSSLTQSVTRSVSTSAGGTTSSTASVSSNETPVVPRTMTCKVLLPTVGTVGSETLREDTVAPEFGLPADLNGDGKIDSKDHSADYQMLPVVIRLEWATPDGGTRTLNFATVIGQGMKK